MTGNPAASTPGAYARIMRRVSLFPTIPRNLGGGSCTCKVCDLVLADRVAPDQERMTVRRVCQNDPPFGRNPGSTRLVVLCGSTSPPKATGAKAMCGHHVFLTMKGELVAKKPRSSISPAPCSWCSSDALPP